MLYISRKINDTLFVVTDTDDSVSTKVSADKIKEFVSLGVDIKGATKYVVDVYNENAAIAKLNVLVGIQLKVSNGVLSQSECTDRFNSNFTLRLSDYCDKILISGLDFKPKKGSKLTIKLDDKIKDISFNAFHSYNLRSNLIFDITEFSNETYIEKLYNESILYLCDSVDIIIDNNIWRKRKWFCIALMERVNDSIDTESIDFDLSEYDDIIYQRYMYIFYQFKTITIHIQHRAPSYVKIDNDFYKDLSNLDFVVSIIASSTQIQRKSIAILCNYIMYFGGHEEVLEVYKNFMSRFVRLYTTAFGR